MTFRSPAESPDIPTQPAFGPLLDALQRHILDRAVPALDSALADIDDYLFDRSQTGEESLGLMALRDMRRARSEISRSFRQSVVDRFRSLRDRRLHEQGDLAGGPGLSLLSEQALEEQLAVEQVASSVLRAHASAFEVASKRFCVVVGVALLDSRENPLNPVFLASSLGRAMGQLEMDAELRIVVFKFFERELVSALGDIYERCNTLMATAGVLPELRATQRAQSAHGHRGHAPQKPMEQEQRDQASAGGVSHQGRSPDSAPMQINAADQAMFANMLGMLQGWRSAVGMAAPAGAAPAGPTLGTGDLMSILSLMQQDATSAFMPAAAGEQQSLAGQLRQQMAQSARKLGVAGDNLNLDGLDGDAVDLVALLFDVLLDGPQYDTRIRQKIGRMLVPFVKVAVKDRRMFMYKEHPARRLLNTVAEACEGNRGEAPQERELLTQVDQTIDRLVSEFNEDVAIFETLEQELRAYMAQHRKRFELAEKRSTEAQRGRERLEQARASVQADLGWHRADRALPPVIEEFLNKHAMHHLVQIALRDGKGSPRYDSAMRAVDDLLAANDRAMERKPPDLGKPLPEAELLAMLASAGCIGDAGEAALEALNDALSRLAEGEPALAVDARMPAEAIMPEPAPPLQEPLLEAVGGTAGMDFDAAMLARIRTLQVGHWIQLQAGDGHFAPAKVSWISPISSRLLLVNRRGIRVLVASVQELAVMAKLGKVLVREGTTAFEDAMHQVAGRLQSVATRL